MYEEADDTQRQIEVLTMLSEASEVQLEISLNTLICQRFL